MTSATDTGDMLEVRRRKLRFRSWHRGMRESDLILGPYADAHLAALTAEELDQYEKLLDISDTLLVPWLTVRDPAGVDADLLPILTKVRNAAGH
jgi:antitoxin CptB